MEGNSETKSGMIEQSNTNDADEVKTAALILLELSQAEIDQSTFEHLQSLRSRTLVRNNVEINEVPTHAPKFGYSIDGTKLPNLPYFQNLHSIIDICGEPFEKQLTESDVNNGLNRILLKKDDIKLALQPLMRLCEVPATGIAVTIYDGRNGNEYKGELKIWAKKMHVITGGGWKCFYKNHELRAKKDWVSIWMFRHVNGKLCIALDWKRALTTEILHRQRNHE